MFTLEIGGRPMAVMNTNEDDARAIMEGEGFREDLMRLKSGNEPLWDGQAPLTLRPASPEEVAEFEESQEEDEDEDEEDATTILFLVPLDDEEDEEEEEEE